MPGAAIHKTPLKHDFSQRRMEYTSTQRRQHNDSPEQVTRETDKGSVASPDKNVNFASKGVEAAGVADQVGPVKRNRNLESELDAQEQAARYEQEVKDIVKECHNRYATDRTKPQKGRGGKNIKYNVISNKRSSTLTEVELLERFNMYKMPDSQQIRLNFKKNETHKKQILLKELSKNENQFEGMLTVTDLKRKRMATQRPDTVEEYVNNFSHVADYFEVRTNSGSHNRAFDFGKLIKQKAEANVVKLQIFGGIKAAMKKAAEKRTMGGSVPTKTIQTAWDKAKQKPSIYQHGERQDKMTLQNVADNFSNSIAYQQRMKQRDMEEDFKQKYDQAPKIDPRIRYMKGCLQNMNMTLPILDKIYNKTLCLQDYHLSEGNCKGLADACEFLDCQIVNRMLFNNCGITGDQLATILDGCVKMKDFKALIYKMNSINSLAIEKMGPLFCKRIPNHLEELSIVDCKMTATMVEQLMDSLIQNNGRLKKLTLVNANHTDRSFEKIIEFVEDSPLLKDLDLSWSNVRPQIMLKLLQVISTNRELKNLTLSYNQLLEEQKTDPNPKNKEDGKDQIELSDFNKEVVSCFQDFIKYNPFLQHLNLEKTGLIEPAIKFIASLLRKSQALRCLHLCGNEGLSLDLIEWIRTRIHAKPDIQPVQLRTHSARSRYGNENASPVNRKGLFKAFRGQSLELQQKDDTNQQWKDIRQGVKLRNIVQSMRMNDMNLLQPGMESQKLIIQRKLGHKELIPGIAQWGLFTGSKDECWICGCYIMTIFVWTPRIGNLASIKDPITIKHYEDEINAARKDWGIKPGHHDGVPYIITQSTNNIPVRMREVIPYCQKHDPQRPNFLQECAQIDGTVRAYCVPTHEGQIPTEKLTLKEEEVLREKSKAYYQEFWHKTFHTMIRYKNPSVANAESYDHISLKGNKDPIFFHVDFCKPGKNTYIIEHKEAESLQKTAQNFFSVFAGAKPEPKIDAKEDGPTQIYVHQMLSQLRNEIIPEYHNPRHVRRHKVDLMKTKNVFQDWHEDQAETYSQLIKHDWAKMLISEIVLDPKQQQKIQNELVYNMRMIKEIYHYLQSKSRTFPTVDAKTVLEFLIRQIKFEGKSRYVTENLNNIVLETCVQGELRRGEGAQIKKSLYRYQLCEVMVRFSIFMYCDRSMHQMNSEYLKNKDQQKEVSASKYDKHCKPAQAFYMFIENQIKPFFEDTNINWQEFRDEHLWTKDVELCYTLNEVSLRTLFSKYCVGKAKTLCQEDYVRMVVRDTNLQISERQVREAYSLSKQTVIQETLQKERDGYNKTTYVEFLEVIARLAIQLFEQSEMEEETLQWKIEHILDELLNLIGATLVKNRIVIEEFSDSDEDY